MSPVLLDHYNVQLLSVQSGFFIGIEVNTGTAWSQNIVRIQSAFNRMLQVALDRSVAASDAFLKARVDAVHGVTFLFELVQQFAETFIRAFLDRKSTRLNSSH